MAESSSGGGVPPWLNSIMRWLLQSPLHGLVSRRIMLITFNGRKSGKTYTTPVDYVREGDTVTLFTHGKWWRNLTGGAPVTLRLRGEDVRGTAEVTAEDKTAVADGLEWFLTRLPADARYYGVTFDENKKPRREDCERGAQDAIMVRVKLA